MGRRPEVSACGEDTVCVPGEQGMTYPTTMDEAQRYLKDRTPARVQVDFSKTGGLVPSFEFRDQADALIRDNRPVILLLGVEHYALAYGYRKKKCTGFDKHEFKINEGQGPGGERWTSANTWFVGQLRPAPGRTRIHRPRARIPVQRESAAANRSDRGAAINAARMVRLARRRPSQRTQTRKLSMNQLSP